MCLRPGLFVVSLWDIFFSRSALVFSSQWRLLYELSEESKHCLAPEHVPERGPSSLGREELGVEGALEDVAGLFVDSA